jgi:hypothetical protein
MLIDTLSIDDARWNTALSQLRHDFYHQPAYVQLEAHRIGATPEAFLVSDGDRLFFVPYLVRSCNLLFPGIQEPVFDVVSPYGYPGILMSDQGRNAEFAAQGFAALRETFASRGVCAAFLRMNPILGDDFDSFFPPDAFQDSSQTVVVDLEPSELDLRKQIRRAFQQTLRKCQGLGYTVRVVSLVEVLDTFVELYKQTMDRVQAKESYYFDRDYFLSLARLPGVHCCVIESGSTVVSASVFFECDGIVNTHLGGTHTEYLSKSPGIMAMFEVMLWAKSRGHRWLQLGGGVGGRDDSLLHFKAGFSDKRIQFLTSRLIIDETKYGQLVCHAANEVGLTPETVLSSNFFPAYRS